MKPIFFFGMIALCILSNSFAIASQYCEGQCTAYWESSTTLHKTGSVYSEVTNEIKEECRKSESGSGIVRYYPDCIDHGSYTSCTLKCNHPVRSAVSTSASGVDRDEIWVKIRDYCTSYYSSYRNHVNFSVNAQIGACR